jgi:hypothetical protein
MRFHYLRFTNALSLKLKNTCRLSALKRRVILIFLFPVIVPILLLGWVLYVIGDRQTSDKPAPERKIDVREEESTSSEDNVEVGLIEESLEEQ